MNDLIAYHGVTSEAARRLQTTIVACVAFINMHGMITNSKEFNTSTLQAEEIGLTRPWRTCSLLSLRLNCRELDSVSVFQC